MWRARECGVEGPRVWSGGCERGEGLPAWPDRSNPARRGRLWGVSENQNVTEEKSSCGCGGACGGGHGKRVAGGPARHVDSPAAQERKGQGHTDLSEGRLNLGLRTAK